MVVLTIEHPPDSAFTKHVTGELEKLASRVIVKASSEGRSLVTACATLAPLYQKGTRLIQMLAAAKYRIEINERLAEEMDVDERTGKKSPAHSMTEKVIGTRIPVYYSWKKTWELKVWRNEKARTTEWEALPKHIELGHELVHALRRALHTDGLGYGATCKYRDVTGRWRTEKVGSEEAAVIGLGPENAEGRGALFITENLLRKETSKRPGSGGRPRQRVGYEGRDPVTKIVS